MKKKWKVKSKAAADREYLALVSYLSLRSFRKLPQFLRYALQIERQLVNTGGLIGYSLEAALLQKKFWTLSVWEDEESLKNFVSQVPHGKAMEQFAGHTDEAKVTYWTLKGSSLPLNWGEAKERLARESDSHEGLDRTRL